MRRRRMALEWGLILAVGVVLALSTLWGSSYFIDDTLIYLGIPYLHGLHFTLGGGGYLPLRSSRDRPGRQPRTLRGEPPDTYRTADPQDRSRYDPGL
jgi:hypothetical protein